MLGTIFQIISNKKTPSPPTLHPNNIGDHRRYRCFDQIRCQLIGGVQSGGHELAISSGKH